MLADDSKMPKKDMNARQARMRESGRPPVDQEIAAWIGEAAYAYWKEITRLIEHGYPDVFSPEWLFGGLKHGWSLRYKKSKSFCTLIPEKERFALLIVFGAQERAKVEALQGSLSQSTRKAYDEATTYHDGKWVLFTIDSDQALEDALRLLAIKRRPRRDR